MVRQAIFIVSSHPTGRRRHPLVANVIPLVANVIPLYRAQKVRVLIPNLIPAAWCRMEIRFAYGHRNSATSSITIPSTQRHQP